MSFLQAHQILSHGHFHSWADIEQTLALLEDEIRQVALDCQCPGNEYLVYAAALKVMSLHC